MSLDLFKELLPSILTTKEDILEDEKEYNAYIINRAISPHIDCVLHANQMNMMAHLPRKMQYDYLRHATRKMKRGFKPWHKLINDENINIIKQFFGYSTRKAEEVYDFITKEQLEHMKQTLRIGGKC